MHLLSTFWRGIQAVQEWLLPELEETLGPLTEAEQRLVVALELARLEEFLEVSPAWTGRPLADRRALARAFVAKAVLKIPTTVALIEQLRSRPTLRRWCGWERAREIPSEATFSRAFEEFALTALPQRAHEALIRLYGQAKLVGHVSLDSTAIEAREHAAPQPKPAPFVPPKVPKKRGRPKKGEERPAPEPTRIQQQVATLQAVEREDWELTAAYWNGHVATACDWGGKKNSQGKYEWWKGYKFHVAMGDGGIPLAALLTAASVPDSQLAVPLLAQTACRVTALYDLADAAYDAEPIRAFSRSLGRVPIIDANPRRTTALPMEKAAARRYAERTTVERGFSRLKEDFGGRWVRVRGPVKVFAHLMFGLLAVTADHLARMVT